MSNFEETLSRSFGASMTDSAFVNKTHALLQPLGFTADNAIACVATCRDEICRPLREHVERAWGEAFNFASLAGMLTPGRTGFGALHGHAPTVFERRQHVYYGMPHIGISASGKIGEVARPGMSELSLACGALFALAADIERGPLSTDVDLDDPEQSILRMKLAPAIAEGGGRGPIDLVELAARAIQSDFEDTIAATVDTSEVDYALFIGIQVHGPDKRDFVVPRAAHAVVRGKRQELVVI